MASEFPDPQATEPSTRAQPAEGTDDGEAYRPSEVPPPGLDDNGRESEPPPGPNKERRRFESRLPGLIRRGIEKGIEAGLNTFEKSLETGRETTGAMREAFSEVRMPRDVANAVGKALQEARLPREIAGAVFSQIDDTKNDVLRIVAREVRDFLQATDLANEIKSALTSLSFEVRTEIRFIPNDAGTGVKPEVRSRGRVKRAENRERGRKRGRSEPPEEERLDTDEEG